VLTSSEVGLTAVVGAVLVGVGTSWVQVYISREAARDSLALAREERLWPERAEAYVAWLASASQWSAYRDGIDPVVTFEGQVSPALPSDFQDKERDVRARVSAFASDEVRALLDTALGADRAFAVAISEKRTYISMHSATGRFAGDGSESLRLHGVAEERRADAKAKDEAVADRMRGELQARV
jgi:hypothetical protein